jgi:uncharacterized membrane protein (UPF0127 family)
MAGRATVNIGSHSWDTFFASSPDELVAGLANLESILPDTGMFFDTGYYNIISVTTLDMLFNLDIIFIDSDFKVVEVCENVLIGNVITSGVACRYFLEVNAGEAAGILPGDNVSLTLEEGDPPVFPAIPPVPVVEDPMSNMYNMIIAVAMVAMAANLASVDFGGM